MKNPLILVEIFSVLQSCLQNFPSTCDLLYSKYIMVISWILSHSSSSVLQAPRVPGATKCLIDANGFCSINNHTGEYSQTFFFINVILKAFAGCAW